MIGKLSTLVFLVMGTAAMAQSIVPVRAIRLGSIIGLADVTSVNKKVEGAITVASAVVGLEARVTLYPGRAIHQSHVGPPAVHERNAIVRMIYQTGRLSITAEGRVLDRAGTGDRVRVMNLGSRQTVTGLVRSDGIVEVGK